MSFLTTSIPERIKKDDQYRQCKLRRKTETGFEYSVGYIEEMSKLKLGARIRVKFERQDSWSENWEVISIGSLTNKSDVRESDYRLWRFATDV